MKNNGQCLIRHLLATGRSYIIYRCTCAVVRKALYVIEHFIRRVVCHSQYCIFDFLFLILLYLPHLSKNITVNKVFKNTIFRISARIINL